MQAGYKRRQQVAATQNANSTISCYTKRTVTQQGRRTQIKYKMHPYPTPLWTKTRPPYAAKNTVNSRMKNLKINQNLENNFISGKSHLLMAISWEWCIQEPNDIG
ncbi:hypothetical protein SO802_014240 [Lithocarpus litseifolius]|uniref:Uncharacterized protein n=1 Tax=Lithocarpus litseifolius TaxID=425828 RepID=A0AAW2CSK3_9ROSI